MTVICEHDILIAEFMGYYQNGGHFYPYNGARGGWFKYPKYSVDWNWLMQVVEKIESLYDDFHGYFGVHISSNSCSIQGTKLRTDPGNEHYAYYIEIVESTKRKAVYDAVVLFIRWYNEHKKSTNDKKNNTNKS